MNWIVLVPWGCLIAFCGAFSYHWTKERNGWNVFWLMWFFMLSLMAVMAIVP